MNPNDEEAGTPAAPPADPFSVFVAAHQRARKVRAAKRFNSGEHIWLGGTGAANAVRALQRDGAAISEEVVESIPRKDRREQLTYGEIVALSGDFYGSPTDLFDEQKGLLPWLWEDNDLSDLREIFAKEMVWIKTPPGARKEPYPDSNVRMAWNAKAYVELALKNTDHFGWHNIRAYLTHHAEALRLAREARGERNETFRRALYTNGFADHFLTDAFAAGHIRVPRAEIRVWAEREGFGETIAGALSKILHDQDGHIDLSSLHATAVENQRGPGDGLLVQNSKGTTWSTRCDGQLFMHGEGPESEVIKQAINAVAASVTEVLMAWTRGRLPGRTYEATSYVPFPAGGSPRLIDKFSVGMSDADREKLWGSVGWYAKIPWVAGLERTHIAALLQALPKLMEEFRAKVAADVETVPEISTRIAAPYIEGFRRIS